MVDETRVRELAQALNTFAAEQCEEQAYTVSELISGVATFLLTLCQGTIILHPKTRATIRASVQEMVRKLTDTSVN